MGRSETDRLAVRGLSDSAATASWYVTCVYGPLCAPNDPARSSLRRLTACVPPLDGALEAPRGPRIAAYDGRSSQQQGATA